MMHVFGVTLVEAGGIADAVILDLLQPLKNGDQFVIRQNACFGQSARVGNAGGNLLGKQALIEGKRALPSLELRVERLPKAA